MSAHEALAIAWAQWNGQRATPSQVDRIMRTLTLEQLERMMAKRGITLGVQP